MHVAFRLVRRLHGTPNMSVYNVPKPEWAAFFDRLNGMEEGELVSVEVFSEPGSDRGDEVASSRPLLSVALAGDERLCISVGLPPEIIELARPVGLRFELSEERGPASLIVDAESGEHLVVRFERPFPEIMAEPL